MATAAVKIERIEAMSEASPAAAMMPLLAIALPALCAFMLLVVFVIAEAAGANPIATAPDANVAEAIAFGDAGRALAFIMSGQDPNQRWTVRQDLLDDRGPLQVTAVQAAILSRRWELVELMLRHGARADSPRGLACLSQALGIGERVPPSVFGLPGDTYYEGPRTDGGEALERCGLAASK
jgi:hypothetical protein